MQQCIELSRTNGRGLHSGAENSGLFDEAKPYFRKHYSGNVTSEKKSLGDWSDRGTPGHIPNPVVKAVSADGTWGATPWESRSSPRDFSLSHLDP